MLKIRNPAGYFIHSGHEPDFGDGHTYHYVMAGNGVFKVARNAYLLAIVPLATCKIVGLPLLRPKVQLRKGELPAYLLDSILHDARSVATASPKEALYHIRMDGLNARIVRPRQNVGETHAVCVGDGGADVIMDIHSHCDGAANFSPIDDRDEVGFRLYGVIGTIFTRPQIQLRVGVYGDFWTVPLEMLFFGKTKLAEVKRR